MTVNELDAPDYARPAIRRLNETLAELRTTRIRFANAGAEIRPRERPDLAAMAHDVATAPDAPPELARVARAVAEGRTTWVAIASGAAEDLPEMVALRQRGERIRDLLTNGQVELEDVMWRTAPAPRDTPAAATVVEDDDEPRDSFMVRGNDWTPPPAVRQTWRRRRW